MSSWLIHEYCILSTLKYCSALFPSSSKNVVFTIHPYLLLSLVPIIIQECCVCYPSLSIAQPCSHHHPWRLCLLSILTYCSALFPSSSMKIVFAIHPYLLLSLVTIIFHEDCVSYIYLSLSIAPECCISPILTSICSQVLRKPMTKFACMFKNGGIGDIFQTKFNIGRPSTISSFYHACERWSDPVVMSHIHQTIRSKHVTWEAKPRR